MLKYGIYCSISHNAIVRGGMYVIHCDRDMIYYNIPASQLQLPSNIYTQIDYDQERMERVGGLVTEIVIRHSLNHHVLYMHPDIC